MCKKLMLEYEHEDLMDRARGHLYLYKSTLFQAGGRDICYYPVNPFREQY